MPMLLFVSISFYILISVIAGLFITHTDTAFVTLIALVIANFINDLYHGTI